MSAKNLSHKRRFSSERSAKSIFVPMDNDSLKRSFVSSEVGAPFGGRRVGEKRFNFSESEGGFLKEEAAPAFMRVVLEGMIAVGRQELKKKK